LDTTCKNPQFTPIKTSSTLPLVIVKCLFQARKVISHVFVGIDFASFYNFSIGFWNCSNFYFHFHFTSLWNFGTSFSAITSSCSCYSNIYSNLVFDVTLNGMLFSIFFVMPFWYLPPACLPCPWHVGKFCRDLTVVYWSMVLTSMACFYHPKTWKVGQEKIFCLALYPFHTFSECLHSPTSEIKQHNFILIEVWRGGKGELKCYFFNSLFLRIKLNAIVYNIWC